MPRRLHGHFPVCLVALASLGCPRRTPVAPPAPSRQLPACVPDGAAQTVGQRAVAGVTPSLATLGGQLTLAWLARAGTGAVSAGVVLGPRGNVTLAIAPEPTGAVDHPGGSPPGAPDPVWSRAVVARGTGSALTVRTDSLTRVPDDGGTVYRLSCGTVTAQPFTVSRAGFERVVPGALYDCMAVGGAAPFVLALGTPADQDVPRGIDHVDLHALSSGQRTRTAPAMALPWAYRAETPAGDVIDPFLLHLGRTEMAVAEAPGTGYALAFLVDGALWTAWLSPTLTALGPPAALAMARGTAVDIALGWNGREALLVYDGDGALHAARMAPGHPVTEALALPAAEITGSRSDQPAVAGLSDGTWLIAWRVRAATAWGTTGGAVMLRRYGDALTPAPDAQTVIPDGAWRPQIAVRGDRYVLAAGTSSGQPAGVTVAAGRCPAATRMPAR